MEAFRFHANLFIDADRGRSLSEPLVGSFEELGADAFVVKEDTGLPEERGEARRIGEVLLKLEMPAIADIGQPIGNTDDLVAVSLSFHERGQNDVAVGAG